MAQGSDPAQPRLLAKLFRWFDVPVLTPGRVGFAFAVAALTDAAQLLLGPLGWVLIDEILDVVAMVLTSVAIGFHLLLLPTFVIEFLPVTDMLPTWTGCVGAVILLRKNAQRPVATPPKIEGPPLLPPPTIEGPPLLPPSGTNRPEQN